MVDETPIREEGTRVRSHALIQASRRADWRFLLPDPNLGDVAYMGPEGEHPRALRLFCRALTLLEAAPPAGAQYDLVALCQPQAAQIAWAAELVRPGGHIYVELDRPLGRRLRRGAPAPRTTAEMLRAAGFVAAELHCHWPRFARCTEIVPLGEPQAMALAVTRRSGGLTGRLKVMVGGALLRLGLLPHLVPSVSLLAQKEGPA